MYLQVGIRSVRLTGSMSIQQRDTMIDAFTHDPDVTVFLMSLKAGGVALNLTAASHVFLMSPWWNPAGEQIDSYLHQWRLQLTVCTSPSWKACLFHQVLT